MESEGFYTVEPLASSAQVSFNAARSLDLVDYYVDYTSNLSAGFTNTLMIRAVDVAENGDVLLSSIGSILFSHPHSIALILSVLWTDQFHRFY